MTGTTGESNQDVVGARINLDTSKVITSLKTLDDHLKKSAQAFKALNEEMIQSERHYTAMAKAMNQLALSSDERRQKMLKESEALISQRKASAELLTAKKEQLDQQNKLVESKLETQRAIEKRQQALLEQQQKEHQQRLALLQAKAATAGANENLVQARLDRQYQLMKNSHARLEMEAEKHAARMAQLANKNESMSVIDRSSQYLLAGSMYYQILTTAREAINVNKEFEVSLVNIKRVMGDTADVALVKSAMIQDAKEYGYALKEVGAVYTQIAQQGFSERETAAIAKTAFMAANVEESFNGAANAQTLLTGALLNYNMAAEDSMRLLDRLNEVSNQYATDSNKLLQGINRVGASAKNAGVSIDELIGYLTVLNQAGFSGSVAGNAIKSFISFSGRDQAVETLEKYIGTIKQANGEMMPFSEMLSEIAKKWSSLSDVQQREITQAVARGDQASRFIALMENYTKAVDVATTAENSFGSAQRENTLAMTTLEKQSMQMKAVWEELMISIGDSGLLGVMKAMVNTAKVLVDGFNSLPAPVRNTMVAVLALGAAILTLNTGVRLLTGNSLISMVTGLVSASRAMLGLKTATDAANVSQKAFVATPIGLALSAIATVLGVATTAWSYYKGSVNEVNDTTRQHARDTYDLITKYDDLKQQVNDNTRSDQEMKQAKDELAVVIEKISGLMPNLVSQWDEHGRAIDLNITKLEAWKEKYVSSMRIVEQDNIVKLTAERDQLQREISKARHRQENVSQSDLSLMDKWLGKDVAYYQNQFASEVLEKGEELAKVEQKLKNSQDALDLMNGGKKETGSKPLKSQSEPYVVLDLEERKKEFTARMNEYRHLINMEAKGYKDAAGQYQNLFAIRKEFSDLSAEDLYSIDEELYRLTKGKASTAKGLKGSTATRSSSTQKKSTFSLDDIEAKSTQARALIDSATSLMDFYQAKSSTFGKNVDTTSTTIELYQKRQEALHQGNNQLKASKNALHEKQSELNSLYEKGKISLEEYSKYTSQVESKLASLTKEIDQNSAAWWRDQAAIQSARDEQLQNSFSHSEEYIRHQSAIGQMSAEAYYQAWLRVQQRYDAKSSSEKERELRKKADEMVYGAQEKLRQENDAQIKASYDEESKYVDELHQKQIKHLQEVKKEELAAIDTAHERYVASIDEKITAIDRLLKKNEELYHDADYETELSEKQARLALLQSAVGPEGIRERNELQKEIERMQLEHRRELEQRGLEALRDQYTQEKEAREQAFNQEKEAVTTRYDNLLEAFESHKDDVTQIEEAIQTFRVSVHQETNKQVLADLDQFMQEYKAKLERMKQLDGLMKMSEEERDLKQYNANIDKWYTGDAKAKADAHAENEYLRKKYRIPYDTGKLDHFQDGGIVRGRKGSEVPIIAHAGELILNGKHQEALFQFIDGILPTFRYALPDYHLPVSHSKSVTNQYTVSIAEVNLEDRDDVSTFFNEADGLIRRFQTRAGVKA